MSEKQTLTMRVETILDRWNNLPLQKRHALSPRVTAASLCLGELMHQAKELEALVESLEQDCDEAEKSVVPGGKPALEAS